MRNWPKIQELLARYEAGEMEALSRALQGAEDRKSEMGHVWLNDDTLDGYRAGVTEILK